MISGNFYTTVPKVVLKNLFQEKSVSFQTGVTFNEKPVDNRTMHRAQAMVLVLDGNSEIGAHVGNNLSFFYLFKAFAEIESSHKSDFFL